MKNQSKNDEDLSDQNVERITYHKSENSQSGSSNSATSGTLLSRTSCQNIDLEASPNPSQYAELELPQIDSDRENKSDSDVLHTTKKKLAWLRYTGLSVYRRLFSVTFIGNFVLFVYMLTKNKDLMDFVDAVAANFLALALARQPLVVNALFVSFSCIRRSMPLRLRRLCAKIYCYGGVHSGCGIASFIWYTGLVALLTKEYVNQIQHAESPTVVTPAILGLAYTILVLLLSIIVVAYPSVRFKFHDFFEFTHRFSGWTVVILFWPLLGLMSLSAAAEQNQGLGDFLVRFPTFWMLIMTTIAIIYPWALLRKVPVRAESLSSYATRLHFSHTAITFGQAISLSRHPLRDWHSFATFPDVASLPGTSGTTREAPHFSCLVAKAGDWTSHIITHPPTCLWKRAVPIYGFAYVMKVFRRIVLVTTGSGIGPCISCLGDPNRSAMRVVWQTKAPLETYGSPIMDLVTQLDPRPEILDSSVHGRVDMLPLVLKLYREFDAEAVCVISNPTVTKKLVFDCEARGVPAFGPIFDS